MRKRNLQPAAEAVTLTVPGAPTMKNPRQPSRLRVAEVEPAEQYRGYCHRIFYLFNLTDTSIIGLTLV